MSLALLATGLLTGCPSPKLKDTAESDDSAQETAVTDTAETATETDTVDTAESGQDTVDTAKETDTPPPDVWCKFVVYGEANFGGIYVRGSSINFGNPSVKMDIYEPSVEVLQGSVEDRTCSDSKAIACYNVTCEEEPLDESITLPETMDTGEAGDTGTIADTGEATDTAGDTGLTIQKSSSGFFDAASSFYDTAASLISSVATMVSSSF